MLKRFVDVFWRRQTVLNRIIIIAVPLAVFVGLVTLATVFNHPTYDVLFSNLSTQDASSIVSKLTQQNVPYQLTNNGNTIMVPHDQVYNLRLQMAGAGLPSNGTIGYEIFDRNNVLGVSDFTNNIDLKRATEGELDRTIMQLNVISDARVQLALPAPSLYTDNQQPVTASVLVKTRGGQRLTPDQVNSIVHLVAMSVEGLKPSNVEVVDTDGNSYATDSSGGTAGYGQLDAKHRYEQQLEQELKDMLAPVLGSRKVVVRVSVDMNFDKVSQQSETYTGDPVARSTQSTSEVYSGTQSASGVPGVASNTPNGVPSYQQAGTPVPGSYDKTTQTTNNEISRTVENLTKAPGSIQRESVAIIIDSAPNNALQQLVQNSVTAAVGLQTDRGDTLSVQMVPFDTTSQSAAAASNSMTQDQIIQLIRYGIVFLAIVIALIMLAGFLRVMSRSGASATPNTPLGTLPADLATDGELALPGGSDSPLGGIGALDFGMPNSASPFDLQVSFNDADIRKELLRQQVESMARTNPQLIADLITSWLTSDEDGDPSSAH